MQAVTMLVVTFVLALWSYHMHRVAATGQSSRFGLLLNAVFLVMLVSVVTSAEFRFWPLAEHAGEWPIKPSTYVPQIAAQSCLIVLIGVLIQLPWLFATRMSARRFESPRTSQRLPYQD